MTALSRRSARPSTPINRAVIWLMLIGFPALFMPFAVGEDTYCAFEVKVATPSGTPVPAVPVLMTRGDRTTFSDATTAANGVARLCDAPLAPVDIVVGFDVCGSVLVRDLKPKWPETQRVYVTYEKVPCDHLGIASACQVLLRIQDDEGRPLAGAQFEGKPSSGSGSTISDVLGRLFRIMKKREKLEGVVIKNGFEPAHISQECLDDVERNVMLRKQ